MEKNILLVLFCLNFYPAVFAYQKVHKSNEVSVICSTAECFKKFTENFENNGCRIDEIFSDMPSLCDVSVRSETCIYRTYALTGCKMPFYQNKQDISQHIKKSADPITAVSSLCDAGYTPRKVDKTDPKSILVCVEDSVRRQKGVKKDTSSLSAH